MPVKSPSLHVNIPIDTEITTRHNAEIKRVWEPNHNQYIHILVPASMGHRRSQKSGRNITKNQSISFKALYCCSSFFFFLTKEPLFVKYIAEVLAQ